MFVDRDLKGDARQRDDAADAAHQRRPLPRFARRVRSGADRRHLHRRVPPEPVAPAPRRPDAPAVPHPHPGSPADLRPARAREPTTCSAATSATSSSWADVTELREQKARNEAIDKVHGADRVQPRRHHPHGQRQLPERDRLLARGDQGRHHSMFVDPRSAPAPSTARSGTSCAAASTTPASTAGSARAAGKSGSRPAITPS